VHPRTPRLPQRTPLRSRPRDNRASRRRPPTALSAAMRARLSVIGSNGWNSGCVVSPGRAVPPASVDRLGRWLAPAAQVAWRVVDVADRDRPDRGELRRDAEGRPVGIEPLDRDAEETRSQPGDGARRPLRTMRSTRSAGTGRFVS